MVVPHGPPLMSHVKPHMRRRVGITAIFGIAMLLVGGWLGFELATLTNLPTFKLLNIAGVIYGLLGLIVLSELLSTDDRIKDFMVRWIAGAVLWATSVIPLGGLAGAAIGHAHPSATTAGKFFGTFFSYSLLVLLLLDVTVASAKPLFKLSLVKRHQLLGFLLLVSGAVAQLLAAVQDLRT